VRLLYSELATALTVHNRDLKIEWNRRFAIIVRVVRPFTGVVYFAQKIPYHTYVAFG
jgi:hypothetical protein